MSRDLRIDAYIARKPDFARPILEHLRDAVHAACPEVEETIKWSSPFFLYRGELLCMMAAFKAHASFGFWKGDLVTGTDRDAMGQFGRLTSLADLPDAATLAALIRKAMAITDSGAKVKRPLKHPKAPPTPPEDLAAALAANAAAAATFVAFPEGQRREYVDWIVDAKRPETRAKRLEQTIMWLAEGKRRNWKYEGC